MENDFLLHALQSRYQGDMDVALANLKVYQMNPSGIGEHPEIIQAMDMEMDKPMSMDKPMATKSASFTKHTKNPCRISLTVV